MNRRSFLRGLGIGAAAAASPEVRSVFTESPAAPEATTEARAENSEEIAIVDRILEYLKEEPKSIRF